MRDHLDSASVAEVVEVAVVARQLLHRELQGKGLAAAADLAVPREVRQQEGGVCNTRRHVAETAAVGPHEG